MLDTAQRLIAWFQEVPKRSYVVALSGGVDSAVVAQAAALSGAQCLAVTASSPSLAERERGDASRVANSIGIEHRVLSTHEIERQDYRQNDAKRCYYCKSNLFATVRSLYPTAQIVTGTNCDDLGDYRPGLQAAEEYSVRAPLAELGINKAMVRQLAEYWQLPVALKPASPCLASRLAYGVEVTAERLERIDAAEQVLRDLGLEDCRVRLHPQELARIEVPKTAILKLASSDISGPLASRFKQLGFRFVTLDLEGLRSGSLNALVQIGPNVGRHAEPKESRSHHGA